MSLKKCVYTVSVPDTQIGYFSYKQSQAKEEEGEFGYNIKAKEIYQFRDGAWNLITKTDDGVPRYKDARLTGKQIVMGLAHHMKGFDTPK